MKRIAHAVALLASLTAPAWAGCDEGVAAYDRGDDAADSREFEPLGKQGIAVPWGSLGAMYANGAIVPQDLVQAHLWFTLAAAQGSDLVRKKREIVARKMTPAQIAGTQNLVREWKPKTK